MGCVAVCALACFVPIADEFMELKGTLLVIEPVLESEENIALKKTCYSGFFCFLWKLLVSARSACRGERGMWVKATRMARHCQFFNPPKCFYCLNYCLLRPPDSRKRNWEHIDCIVALTSVQSGQGTASPVAILAGADNLPKAVS